MDHWGDPWADDANKPQTKHELTSPLPTTSHAPVLLQGFLDDAQWGSNESGEFGAWATSPRKEDTIHAAVQETRVPDSTDISFNNDAEKALDYNDWGIEKNGQNNNWARSEADPDSPKEPENVVSESSDSATTIQPDEAPEQASEHSVDAAQPDDDLSTRPSTSPSEISHNEATVESPRTSFEEERAVDKAAAAEYSQKAADAVTDTSKVGATALEATTSDGVDDDFGDFEDDAVRDDGLELQRPQETLEDDTAEAPRSPRRGLNNESALTSDTEPEQKASYLPSTSLSGFTIDSELMSQLFPPPKDAEQLEEPPDDPIYSTSARKAWYRLTRKQTMREFNNGNDDDNYIRVTWATSHIRSEVNKIVGRWATEDRMSGKGPGARASFYWDTPAPTHSRAPSSHVRKSSSTSVSSPLRPAKPNVPPLSTKAPAAFNWSSPTTSANPWDQPSPSAQPTPPLLAPKHPAVKAIPRPEGRAVSVDLTPRTIAETLHKRTSTAFDLPKPPAPFAPLPANHLANSPVAGSPLATSSVASSSLTNSPIANSPLPNPSVAGQSSANSPHGNSPLSHSPFANSPLVNSLTANDPWANVNNLDHNPPPSTETAAAPNNDDDDWGEMVQSPAVSNPTPIEPSIRDNMLSTPTSTPKSAKTSPIQNLPPGSKHASPIVRLKSVISPTSARFKLNSYIPAGAEEGPIGPGLLKPANKSVESTPEQKIQSRPVSVLENRDEPASPTFAPQIDVSEDFSAWDTASPQTASTTPKDVLATPEAPIAPPEPVNSPVLPLPPSTQPTPTQTHSSEAWADADFSFFETAALGPSKPSLQIQPKHDPSDPFSIFETATSISPAPLTPFTRPPPRPVTPPTLQPLTGATNSAQKRKAEEDELIKSIVRGLPDLSYMLRV